MSLPRETPTQPLARALASRFAAWDAFFSPPGRPLLWLLLTTPLAVALGLLAGGLWLPLLQACAFYPLFAARLFRSRWKSAVAAALLWAFWTALLVGTVSYAAPEWSSHRILRAQAYQEEMFTWVESGRGAEGDIRLFLPQHALHLGLFSLLCLLSLGFLGLLMGAVLMNYMSFYVGTLLGYALDMATVLAMAWPPWAMCRVAGFIFIAAALSGWAARRLGLPDLADCRLRPALAAGAALIVMDVFLKWWLAPYWQPLLKVSTRLP
ncbi:MAG TPA: hypothetical protein VLU25_18775 [Acidobacteriota bacterium]|nr:hypothetical protein [Acidobacteriota bacterium]